MWQHVVAVCSMQHSGRIKAVGCWFESGQCVGALIRCVPSGNILLWHPVEGKEEGVR